MQISKNIVIPDEELTEEFFLASGPGGQNVNKVTSAVRLRFNVLATTSLLPDVKARLIAKVKNRLTVNGELIIEAQRHRTQIKNRADAAERLTEIIKGALHAPKKRRPTKPTRGSIKRRIDSKKKRSNTKKLRGRVKDD
jgi:ribosome-associated protein